MAFVAAVTDTLVYGSELVKRGTYANDGGSTGGDVVTNMQVVKAFSIRPKGAAILASTPVTNETFPLSNSTGAVTIVTNANESGTWEAIGY